MPKPRMRKLFTGRGKTRPIPRILDASDRLAARIVGATQQPRTSATKAAFGPRVSGTSGVLGTKVGNNGAPAAGIYSPGSTTDNI